MRIKLILPLILLVIILLISGCTSQTGYVTEARVETIPIETVITCSDGRVVDSFSDCSNPTRTTIPETTQQLEKTKGIMSAQIIIDKIDRSWFDYGSIYKGKSGTGTIGGAYIYITNNGTSDFYPLADIKITRNGYVEFTENDITVSYSALSPGEKEKDSIWFYYSIDQKGDYIVDITIKDKNTDTFLGHAFERVSIYEDI